MKWTAQKTINNNNINILNNEILSLSFSIYNNYNNLLATQYNLFNTLINNDNTIYTYAYTISGNLINLQNNIYTYVNNLNDATNITTTSLQNQINKFSPINLLYGINIIPSSETYNAQGGKGTVTRSNYIRFNYGREWCISNQDDSGIIS